MNHDDHDDDHDDNDNDDNNKQTVGIAKSTRHQSAIGSSLSICLTVQLSLDYTLYSPLICYKDCIALLYQQISSLINVR